MVTNIFHPVSHFFTMLRPLKWQNIKLLHETWLDMATWMNKQLMTEEH